MKTLCLVLLAGALVVPPSYAASTINTVNRFAYGANLGWMDWRGDVANGAVIGAFVCSGHIYAANVGWISLGDGTPANGVRYANNSGADFGVNHDGAGNLTGRAYGANIGWLTFTNRASDGSIYGGPTVNLINGRLSGFVWSANCGWISLSTAEGFVQTDSMDYGPDLDGDGIPDMWELQFAANLGVLSGSADTDGDGATNAEEFEADTNPLLDTSRLRLTSILRPDSVAPVTLNWSSSPTRQYRIQSSAEVVAPLPWADSVLGLIPPDAGETTSRVLPAPTDPQRFYIIEAIRPLQP